MNNHEEYAKFIKFCNSVANKLAEMYKLDKVEVKEGTHGVWTGLAKVYKEELGSENKDEIHYFSDNSPYKVINRNFWSNRAISIRKKQTKRSDPEVMCEMSISCSYWDDDPLSGEDDKEYKHYHDVGGKFHVNQIMTFDGQESYELIDIMYNVIQNMIKEYYENCRSLKLFSNHLLELKLLSE